MNPSVASRVRRIVAQATGRHAITWWTWLITAPVALTVMSGLQYVTGGPWAVVAVASVEHLAVGLLLLVGWALLRVTPAPVRAATVIIVFAVVGVLRPVLFLAAGWLLGIPVDAGDLGGRMAINLVTTVAVFSLIAIAGQLVEDHLGVYRRLRAAQEASARDAMLSADRARGLRDSALDAVSEGLERATVAAESHGIRPVDAANLLRELAEQVVRPASHRVFDTDAPAGEESEAGRVRKRDWIASVLGGMQAAPPLLLAVLFAVMVLPFGVWQYGLFFCLPPLVCGLLVMWGGNVLLGLAATRTPPALRAVVLAIGYVLIGLLLSASSAVTVRLMGGDPELVWFEVASYWLVGLGVAFVASLTAQVHRDQSELEEAVQDNIRAAAAIRGDFERERAALARLLHSGVQSELIASALALAAGPSADASAELRRVVSSIRAELSAPRVEPDAAERISALVESWACAIPLRSSFGDDVWERLREPVRAAAVIDTISEGLANAVRHGDGSEVTLDVIAASGDGVSVVIVSGGVLTAAVPGIGLRQLAERGDVALQEVAGRVELAVTIP
ncbi:hypothetical protein ACFRFH_06050 [Leifsonia sp. NPDC056824]|uniref:hypothetical protein n=1 Tax=Leifsonia sp. NPDC056824 TaxID=3345953 RepID=UPI0036C87A22